MVKAQKTVAICIVLASSLLSVHTLGDYAFCGILCVLGLLGLQRRFIWNIRPERRGFKSFLFLLVLVIFALHYRFGDLVHPGRFNPTAVMAWQTITRFFLASMTLVLFLGSSQTLPPSLALFHLGIAISAGQVFLLDGDLNTYRMLEFAAIALTVLYVATSLPRVQRRCIDQSHWWRTAMAFVTLFIFTINAGWIFSSYLYSHQDRLTFLSDYLWGERAATGVASDYTSTVGFSTSGRLSNLLQILQDTDVEPVLTIRGNDNPTYLRARVFDVFSQSEWFAYSPLVTLYPQQEGFLRQIPLPGRKNIFKLGQQEATRWKHIEIDQHKNMPGILFAPLGAAYIEIGTRSLSRDDNDVLYARISRRRMQSIDGYSIAYSRSGYWKAPRPDSLLNVPKDLDARVHQLAERIYANCQSNQDKIDAVVKHFQNNYTYSLGMDAPDDRKALTYFLLEGTSGYCEYFATGTAILLRMAKIPTRYVTGFYVHERDPDTQDWIVRNEHAHAWVEAWDDETDQWQIVEATVQEDDMDDTHLADLMLRNRWIEFWRQFRMIFMEYGLIGALLWAIQPVGWIVWPALSIGIFYLYRTLRRRQALRSHDSVFPISPLVYRLHQLLHKIDRQVRRLGFQRRPRETILDFAERLAGVSDTQAIKLRPYVGWYQQYAGLRYQRSIDHGQVEQLAQNLKKRAR
ncbi:transglutaminase domain-containing protein [Planctomycetota bacterium]